MRTEETYARCRGEIVGLLEAIERNDLARIACRIDLLRGCLAEREPRHGDSTLRLEQLDAIEGLAEAIEKALDTMHRSAAVEIERIRAVGPLLRHLAAPDHWVM